MAAMTDAQIMLIDAVAKNDFKKARSCARICVAEDTTKKNEWECKRLGKLLDPLFYPTFDEMPANLKGMLEAEMPSETFHVSRYYLSPREAYLFYQIDRDREVCYELMQMGIKRSNATLIHGASGTGKTSFGRYVAARFDMPFYYVNFARLVDSLMGKTAQNLAAVFDYIRNYKCVLMLDEIDTVSTRREGSGGGVGGELNRVTVTLMQEFDKLENTQIVIGATNRLDIIDDALIRRFTRIHEITTPMSSEEASNIVRCLLDDTSIDYDEDDLADFCEQHTGKSQAWLINETIDRIASLLAARNDFQDQGHEELAKHIVLRFIEPINTYRGAE